MATPQVSVTPPSLSLGSSAPPDSVPLKYFLSLSSFLLVLPLETPAAPSIYPLTHTRCPDVEGGWWEVHCFPRPSPLTDDMGGGGGGNERKSPPSHPEGPQEPDRKQLQERQPESRLQPQGSGLRVARSPPKLDSENEDSELGIHQDPSLAQIHLPFIYPCFLDFSMFLPISTQLPHCLPALVSAKLSA